MSSMTTSSDPAIALGTRTAFAHLNAIHLPLKRTDTEAPARPGEKSFFLSLPLFLHLSLSLSISLFIYILPRTLGYVVFGAKPIDP